MYKCIPVAQVLYPCTCSQSIDDVDDDDDGYDEVLLLCMQNSVGINGCELNDYTTTTTTSDDYNFYLFSKISLPNRMNERKQKLSGLLMINFFALFVTKVNLQVFGKSFNHFDKGNEIMQVLNCSWDRPFLSTNGLKKIH